MKVTSKQNEYLQELEDGPKTKADLMKAIGVTRDTAGMMIKKLKDVGLITSKRKGAGNALEYSLTISYSEMGKNGLVIRNNKTGTAITDEEVYYIAILRNGGMTGQRLSGQYQKTFPERGSGAIKNIVLKARKQGLCR